jgi:hypothetical protein
MRKNNGESVDHLLLHCDASALWDSIFSLFGLDRVLPKPVVNLFACWRFGSFHSEALWKMISSYIMWYI